MASSTSRNVYSPGPIVHPFMRAGRGVSRKPRVTFRAYDICWSAPSRIPPSFAPDHRCQLNFLRNLLTASDVSCIFSYPVLCSLYTYASTPVTCAVHSYSRVFARGNHGTPDRLLFAGRTHCYYWNSRVRRSHAVHKYRASDLSDGLL
jgi:hypothetical protein